MFFVSGISTRLTPYRTLILVLLSSPSMGHKSTQYTVRYLNFVDHLKDEAMDNMPEI